MESHEDEVCHYCVTASVSSFVTQKVQLVHGLHLVFSEMNLLHLLVLTGLRMNISLIQNLQKKLPVNTILSFGAFCQRSVILVGQSAVAIQTLTISSTTMKMIDIRRSVKAKVHPAPAELRMLPLTLLKKNGRIVMTNHLQEQSIVRLARFLPQMPTLTSP